MTLIIVKIVKSIGITRKYLSLDYTLPGSHKTASLRDVYPTGHYEEPTDSFETYLYYAEMPEHPLHSRTPLASKKRDALYPYSS